MTISMFRLLPRCAHLGAARMGRPLTEFLRSLEACDRDKVTAPIPSRADASHNSGCRAR
jgi:hypothetical protein